MKFNYFLLLTLIYCSSCDLPSSKTPQLWFYTYASGKILNDSTLTPASFIFLNNDGTYTRDFGVFDHGHWSKQSNELLLISSDNIKTILPIKFEGEKVIQLSINGILANFDSQPAIFDSSENNPFALENNQWRIPPTQNETEPQLKKRLQNHFQFWEAYFLWALDNSFSTIDVRSTPTPIKIYGNGFGLKTYKELPTEWRSCFYDSADCQKATLIIKEIFDHRNIAWPHSDNKYKMFISAFQQLERYVK